MTSRTPPGSSASTERFDFEGSAGRKLAGRLERAAGRRRGAVLFAHCFTCGKGAWPAVRISRAGGPGLRRAPVRFRRHRRE